MPQPSGGVRQSSLTSRLPAVSRTLTLAMRDGMSKTERVLAAVRAEEVDRVPVSAWWHDFPREWSAQGLGGATLGALPPPGSDEPPDRLHEVRPEADAGRPGRAARGPGRRRRYPGRLRRGLPPAR